MKKSLEKQIEELKWLLERSCQRGCSHDSGCVFASHEEWKKYWQLRTEYLGTKG